MDHGVGKKQMKAGGAAGQLCPGPCGGPLPTRRGLIFLRVIYVVFFAFSLSSEAALAGDLDVQTTLKSFGQWESNPLMVRSDAKTVRGSITQAGAALVDKTPQTTLDTHLTVKQGLYNDSTYNTTGLYGTASLDHALSRMRFGLTGNANNDTVRNSELSTLGLTHRNVHAFSTGISPHLAYTLTPLSEIGLITAYGRTLYDDDVYTNYRTYLVNPYYKHLLSPLTTVLVGVKADRYETEGRSETKKIDGVSPYVGWIRRLSPRLRLDLSAGGEGLRETESLGPTGSWKFYSVFLGRLIYKSEKNILTLSGERSERPFANGVSSLLSQFTVSLRHELTSKLYTDLKGSYIFADYRVHSIGNLDDQYGGKTSLGYKLTEGITLEASYEYKHETLTNQSGTARNNIALIGLTYQTPQTPQ